MSYIARYLHIRGISFGDRSSTVLQNDSDNTVHILYNKKNNIKIEMLQKNKNTKYNIDNYVCTGMKCANLKCK